VDVEITRLPGLGTEREFSTVAGRRIGVLTHRDGHRELLGHVVARRSRSTFLRILPDAVIGIASTNRHVAGVL
jgi:K+/H+ antiporter YhaU regulatory subunit KhtT